MAGTLALALHTTGVQGHLFAESYVGLFQMSETSSVPVDGLSDFSRRAMTR